MLSLRGIRIQYRRHKYRQTLRYFSHHSAFSLPSIHPARGEKNQTTFLNFIFDSFNKANCVPSLLFCSALRLLAPQILQLFPKARKTRSPFPLFRRFSVILTRLDSDSKSPDVAATAATCSDCVVCCDATGAYKWTRGRRPDGSCICQFCGTYCP